MTNYPKKCKLDQRQLVVFSQGKLYMLKTLSTSGMGISALTQSSGRSSLCFASSAQKMMSSSLFCCRMLLLEVSNQSHWQMCLGSRSVPQSRLPRSMRDTFQQSSTVMNSFQLVRSVSPCLMAITSASSGWIKQSRLMRVDRLQV